MRIAMVGDVHGDEDWTDLVLGQVAEAGCERVVFCGDFGLYWPAGGDEFLAAVNDSCALRDLVGYIIDGNHENHDRLDHDAPDFVPLSGRLHYVPRGHAWTWDRCRFVGLGGAYSVDQWRRAEGISWWADETPSYGQVSRALSAGRADVVIAHEAPSCAEVPGEHAEWKSKHKASGYTRAAVQSVLEVARPHVVFHGHHHVRYVQEARYGPSRAFAATIVGLAANVSDPAGYDGWAVLDTDDPDLGAGAW